MKNKYSFISYFISVGLIMYLSFLYYPKYENTLTEATISWDVSGYYLYLPAIFIYKDIKECQFKDDILKKYYPTPDFQQAMKLPNGNYVMKYPVGQAIQFLPYFMIAHWYAVQSDDHVADGFSKPYQFMITLEGFIMALLGLWFFRLVLLRYFQDKVVGITLIGIAFASNYLDYASINGAMTHNTLFTIYALLIYLTIQFYERPRLKYALGIGALVGFAALTRPTEIISMLIPFFWGLEWGRKAFLDRLGFIKTNIKYLIWAIVVTVMVGSLQLIYWKYVSGNWLVYSYDDQGFNFLRPHLKAGFFSYRSGWLVYSPFMFFSLLGFYYLYKNFKNLFIGVGIFSVVFIYITFAWNIWWYGGSLGIRAMVQGYAVLGFSIAAFVDMTLRTKFWKYGFGLLLLLFSSYNLWLTHQAHKGGLLVPGMMTKAYYWKVLGTFEKNENDRKLLDTTDEFLGERKNISVVYKNDFEEGDSVYTCKPAIQGSVSLCLNEKNQESPSFVIKKPTNGEKWVRISADFLAPSKEWDVWKMARYIVEFKKNGYNVKYRNMRIQRFLQDGKTKNIFFDTKLPDADFDEIKFQIVNSGGRKVILIDNVKIEVYE